MLEHIPARDEVLARLIGALAPGGWLLLEHVDFGRLTADPTTYYAPPMLVSAWGRRYLD